MIVTIDGPAGAGKSTLARALARKLGIDFLDTGAMYRAIGLAVLEQRVDPEQVEQVIEIARSQQITIKGEKTFLGGRDVSELIRTQQVAQASSQVAAIPEVRNILVAIQRKIASQGSFVCEGRDQGSVVFPDADFKFYVTASVERRARRRYEEMKIRTPDISADEVLAEQHVRDERDLNRRVGALMRPVGSHLIETDNLSVDQVLELMMSIIQSAAQESS
ncbi:MAG TPA: (d)CMP kinase [Pirellulaceae bacterium]|nr:(d)CMP kinase [Pirellulaceae bacterium]HMO93407.1 (d)CMP kinase [Pirellulaceae bacterium]HMP70469.1 (d)CMP kinase [Pirellulaceae bacterium]